MFDRACTNFGNLTLKDAEKFFKSSGLSAIELKEIAIVSNINTKVEILTR